MNYGKLVRRIRQRIFDYEDADKANGTKREPKAARILKRAIPKMVAQEKGEARLRKAAEFEKASPKRRSEMLMEAIGFFKTTD